MIFKLMYLIDLNFHVLNLMIYLTLHINCNYIIILIGSISFYNLHDKIIKMKIPLGMI